MAISYSSNPTTQKPFSLLIFTTFLLLVAREVHSAQVLSFNLTKFSIGEPSITLQGNAQILASGVLALTSHANPAYIVGRALYATPLTIWDEATGNVASFVSSLSFSIESLPGFMPADGIVFFIAPVDTTIPAGSTGENLGVVNPGHHVNKFVGVEFDNYVNQEYDPSYPHIGIDANSLISLRTVKWNDKGSLFKVSVIYDSLSKTLSAAVTNENGTISTVAQEVDLKAVLPATVRVGLSAATATGAQKHDIHSWSFTSNLETN